MSYMCEACDGVLSMGVFVGIYICRTKKRIVKFPLRPTTCRHKNTYGSLAAVTIAQNPLNLAIMLSISVYMHI